MVIQTDEFKRLNRIIDYLPNLKRSGLYYIGPCPFCGGRDRFNVKSLEDGDLWICRKSGDGKYHDSVEFFMRIDGRQFSELVNHKSSTETKQVSDGLTISNSKTAIRHLLPTNIDLATSPSNDLQFPAIFAACEASNFLRNDTAIAAVARKYLLEQRKLSRWSLDKCAIGYNPVRTRVGDGWLEPGITIPCMVDGELWYVQVRTTIAARKAAAHEGRRLGKYSALAGSKLGALFNADQLLGATTAFVVEGEFDAMVLNQYCPFPEACAVTMGSAGSLPSTAWLRYFAPVRDVILILDNDEAGHAALARWQERIPRARVACLPDNSKDVTDFRRNGGNLVEWIYMNM